MGFSALLNLRSQDIFQLRASSDKPDTQLHPGAPFLRFFFLKKIVWQHDCPCKSSNLSEVEKGGGRESVNGEELMTKESMG